MPSVCLESSTFFVLAPVPQLASPSTAHGARSPAVVDGVSDPSAPLGVLTGRYGFPPLLRGGGASQAFPALGRAHVFFSSGRGFSILDSGAKPHAASTFLAGGASHVGSFVATELAPPQAGPVELRSVVLVLYPLSLFEDSQRPLPLWPPPES